MMNKPFIYNEKTSALYGPDGTFLKKVFCPKALSWNQLVVEDAADRWRGCEQCEQKVVNLDVANPAEVIAACSNSWPDVCVHASENSGRVIFLKDSSAPPKASETRTNEHGLTVIHTARSLEDINRAVGLGYWPDVRIVQYDSEHIRSKISIDQHQASGLIRASEDYRSEIGGFDAFSSDRIGSTLNWAAAIPFTNFYQYYQESPIAAYLIPKNLPDGTSVLVVDPIEDIVGSTWNQGDSYRATNVPGYILNHRVILDRDKVKVIEFVG